MKKQSSRIKTKNSTKISKEEEKEQTLSILSMGIIDLTFKINFSEEDLEIKEENKESNKEKNKEDNREHNKEDNIEDNKEDNKEESKEDNKENNKESKNKIKSYYNIDDFKKLKDLEFLKDRKEVWDKFQLIPNNSTLEHLLLANNLRRKKVITEYIGFGRPRFIDEEEFFEEIFNYVSKRNNILFNKTPLDKNIECHINFKFVHGNKSNNFEIQRSGVNSNK